MLNHEMDDVENVHWLESAEPMLRDYGWRHKDDDKYIAEALETIAQQLYGDGPLDGAKLDNAVTYLCDELGANVPMTQPTVRRNYLDMAIGLARAEAVRVAVQPMEMAVRI